MKSLGLTQTEDILGQIANVFPIHVYTGTHTHTHPLTHTHKLSLQILTKCFFSAALATLQPLLWIQLPQRAEFHPFTKKEERTESCSKSNDRICVFNMAFKTHWIFNSSSARDPEPQMKSFNSLRSRRLGKNRVPNYSSQEASSI